ncbi:hypothetical protein BpHYR1_007891 [Brachionus plicatilis]|uniref:Uncharacterized protein n=1 Tax=Brachionus plicatilis TaxID=10195 RepID=A0A3M7QJ99_BRAPC|nr:hypothetical protein BpHYR1_007891 [Brachionus plicatilis]
MLENLRERFCPIPEGCRRRGDIIGKNNVKEIKNFELANNLTVYFNQKIAVGDLMCKKHFMLFYKRQTQNNVNETSNSEENNSSSVIQDNCDIYENVQPTTSENIEDYTNESIDQDECNFETIDQTEQDDQYSNYNMNQNTMKTVLNISRGYASHSFCFICKRKTCSKPMTVLSVEAIIDIYMKRDILINRGARSCSDHLTESYYVKDDCIDKIPVVSETISLTNEKVQQLIEGFKEREQKRSSLFKKFGDFSTLNEELCCKITGFTREELSFFFQS